MTGLTLFLWLAADGGAVDPRVPSKAEVELSGQAKFPNGATATRRVYVTTGGCFTPEMQVLASVQPTADGHFFAEVFVPTGSKLWICAALVPKAGKITLWGAADGAPFEGRGNGEVVFANLKVPVTKRAPVDPPH
jgi:hypothetical protein